MLIYFFLKTELAKLDHMVWKRGSSVIKPMDWRWLEKCFRKVQPDVSFCTLHKATATREGKGVKGQLEGDTCSETGKCVGWNDSLAMVIAELEKWKKLISVRIFH